ncbi:MAG: DUF5702 domain-containing protein [Lachnospiraceae bacterium]
MELFQKNRGSVSIFLVIILVPVIVVCSIFVDASRIQLSRAMAMSSADLTLHTALSYYDLELSDYYGLLASSQSQEEFLANSKTFFEGCMISQGIDPSDADEWASVVASALGKEDDIVDLLQIEVIESTYNLAPVEGANLADATMIKNAIVDFMKYRAPIELLADGSGMVAKLKKVGEIQEIIPVETLLQNEKQEYYEAESELLKLCGDIYLDFKDYDEQAFFEVEAVFGDDKGISERLIEIRDYLDGLEEQYKALHSKMVMDLYNTEDCEVFVSVQSNMTVIPDSGSYTDADADTLRNLIGQCWSTVSEYDEASAALQAKLDSISFSVWDDSYYDIQYWIQLDAAISGEYDNYIKKLFAMRTANAKLVNAYANREVREAEWDWVEVEYPDGSTEIVYQEVESAYDAKDEYTYNDAYALIEQSYAEATGEIGMRVSALSTLPIYSISGKLQEISSNAISSGRVNSADTDATLDTISQRLSDYEDYLSAADYLLAAIQDEMGEIDDATDIYEAQYGEWKGFATVSSGVDSDIVKTDLHEIAVIEGTESPAIGEEDVLQQVQIDQQEVQDCLNRVNAVRALFGTYLAAIEAYQYGWNTVRDTYSYDLFKNQSGVDEACIVVDKEALEAYAEESFAAAFVKPVDPVHNITDNNNPDFNVNRPAFRDWLDGQFDGKNLTDKDTSGDIMDQINDVLEKKQEEAEKQQTEPGPDERSDNEISEQANLPSNGAVGDLSNYGGEDTDGVASTTTLFGGLDFVSVLESSRDKLLLHSYITNMFTYNTYVKESKYELAMAEKPDREITLTSYPEIYGFESIKTAWGNEDTTFTANKTLTNKMKSFTNNFSYGNEIEYIIYGGSNASNTAKSFGTIFGIRYAMNITPVFGMYWNAKAVVYAATTLSAATSGIIPVSLIKLVLCLGITAAETAMDIAYLKAGIPVLFAKTKDDLYLQFNLEALEDTVTELAGDVITTKGSRGETEDRTGFRLDYGDYLGIFLFIALCVDEEGVCLRTADVIQCNMDFHDGKMSNDYVLSNAVTYYALNADVRVRPMMLALPWSRPEVGNMLDSTTWNSFHIEEIRGY